MSTITAHAGHFLAAEPKMSDEAARAWLVKEHGIRLSLEDVVHAQGVAEALKARFERQFDAMFPRLETHNASH